MDTDTTSTMLPTTVADVDVDLDLAHADLAHADLVEAGHLHAAAHELREAWRVDADPTWTGSLMGALVKPLVVQLVEAVQVTRSTAQV